MSNLQEQCRLAFQLKGIINRAEICVSKLRNGFLDDNDYNEMCKTIGRLDREILEVNVQIVNGLNSGKDT